MWLGKLVLFAKLWFYELWSGMHVILAAEIKSENACEVLAPCLTAGAWWNIYRQQGGAHYLQTQHSAGRDRWVSASSSQPGLLSETLFKQTNKQTNNSFQI